MHQTCHTAPAEILPPVAKQCPACGASVDLSPARQMSALAHKRRSELLTDLLALLKGVEKRGGLTFSEEMELARVEGADRTWSRFVDGEAT